MLEITLDSQWYYSSNGKDYGPVSWSIIESMLQDDRLSPQDLVLQQGCTTYLRIEEVIHQMASPGNVARADAIPSVVTIHQATVSEPPPVPRDPPFAVSPAPWPDPGDIAPADSDSGEYRLEAVPESPPLDPEAFLPKPVRSAKSAKLPKAAKVYHDPGSESDSGEKTSASVTESPSRNHPIPDAKVAPQHLLFALQVGIVWALSTAVLLVLGIQLGPWIQSIVSVVSFFLLLLYYNVVAATVGHMVSLERERGRPVSSWAGMSFAFERVAPLIIGPLIVGVGAGSLIAVTFGLIHGLSHSASMGGILFLPTFLLVVGILCLAMFGSLIPIVMGVEDCSPSDALKACQDRNRGSYARTLLDYAAVLSRITPAILLSLVVVLLGLYGAAVLTVDLKILTEFKLGFSAFLYIISFFVVTGCWLAFVFVLLTTHLAALYCESQT